ncbi:hypothetical protein TNIN_314621 [Trichonephila inaurata madagascariensis]|uniref:Uncharacterized protein n=1 Tax=Trichonephila inaurata madagascariensis TaxID=2747483 RepID=A0A8X6Y276_9ARAC|nr:hypothetical protein TNIN_314621 [Trichonephila inaurata madagascariensis]
MPQISKTLRDQHLRGKKTHDPNEEERSFIPSQEHPTRDSFSNTTPDSIPLVEFYLDYVSKGVSVPPPHLRRPFCALSDDEELQPMSKNADDFLRRPPEATKKSQEQVY